MLCISSRIVPSPEKISANYRVLKFSNNSVLDRFDAMVRDVDISFFPADLQTEIKSRIEFQRETIEQETEDYGDADEGYLSSSSASLVYGVINDIYETPPLEPGWRKVIHLYWIRIGAFREISQEEMSTMVITNGKKYDFKMGGKFYIFENHPI